MKVHNLKFIICIGVLIIVIYSIANLIYFQAKKLEEPVFLEHYYEVPVFESDSANIELYYLKNISDTSKIIDVSFPEIENVRWSLSGEFSNNISTHYDLEEISLSLSGNIFTDIDKKLVLENAIFTFDNGLKKEVDLGKIILIKSESSGSILNTRVSSSSNAGESSAIIKVNAPVTIDSITTYLSDETLGLVNMGIEVDNPDDIEFMNDPVGARYYDLTENNDKLVAKENLKFPFSAEQSINIVTKFNIDDPNKQLNVYKLLYLINYTTTDGETGSERLYNVSYTPYFSDENIKNFLDSRGL